MDKESEQLFVPTLILQVPSLKKSKESNMVEATTTEKSVTTLFPKQLVIKKVIEPATT